MKLAFYVLSVAAAASGAVPDNIGWLIVGGKTAKDGQFPYQISLRTNGSHLCGGSILDEYTIICAAHCVDRSSLTVLAGTNTLNKGGTIHNVRSVVPHKDYNSQNLTNDISIIKLETPIEFNAKVQPVQLQTEYVDGGAECTLSGWGRIKDNGRIPNNLQFIKLKTISFADCKNRNETSIVVGSNLCTFTKKGKGACHGDSGGPLVDSRNKLIGIVSWGVPCARGFPDVFTRISSFLDWIEANR